ncbi:MAG: hypothetical protein ABW110_10045 [Steroidobacteraceae bacterium]
MTLRILFVPVSGAGGAGEFMRSLIIARAIRERLPAANIHFIVNAEARYAQQLEFPSTVIQGSPTYNVAAVNAALERERPHVVVFDSSGRVAQYRRARAVGARVVYVSSRFKTRWKGFRLRRMRYLDQHWIAQPRFLGAELTRWERLKIALVGHVEPVFVETLFETPQAARQQRLLSSFGVERDRFVVLCIGGGGSYAGVSDASATLLAAASRIHSATGLTCIDITGPNAPQPSTAPDGVRMVAALSNGELMDLMTAAHVAVVNGGSLLLQTIANRVPAVAVPVAGDQGQRIQKCAALGLVVSCTLDANAIERDIVRLVSDERARLHMRSAMERIDLRNGTIVAVDALVRLMGQRRAE